MRRVLSSGVVVVAVVGCFAVGIWLGYDYYRENHGDWRIAASPVAIGLGPLAAFGLIVGVFWLLGLGFRALRHPAMRLPLAIAVVAVCLAGALYVHQRKITPAAPYNYFNTSSTSFVVDRPRPIQPSWEDPVAVLLAIGGFAIAAALLTTRRRPAPAAAFGPEATE